MAADGARSTNARLFTIRNVTLVIQSEAPGLVLGPLSSSILVLAQSCQDYGL